MAASGDSMQNITSALCQLATEKLTNTHLTALKTVTEALRDEQFRYYTFSTLQNEQKYVCLNVQYVSAGYVTYFDTG